MESRVLRKFIVKYTLLVSIIILSILKFDMIISILKMVWEALSSILLSLFIAYLINIIMVVIEKRFNFLGKTKLKNWKRPISLLSSLIILFLIVYLLVSLVVPSVIQSIKLILDELPRVFNDLQSSFENIFKNNTELKDILTSAQVDSKLLLKNVLSILGGGISETFGNLFKIFNIIIGGILNSILIFIFALYIVLDKERFIRIYQRLAILYLTPKRKKRLDLSLTIIHKSFSSFIQGQCIEAFILGSLCALGMFILRMPSPLMIGTLVGLLNIIPIVGAYIGGAIGILLILTVKPSMAIGFLIFLILLQQFESNIIYPRVVGNVIGLPGVYVLGAVMFFGALAGLPGMFFGIPLVASIYKLSIVYIENKEREKESYFENKTR